MKRMLCLVLAAMLALSCSANAAATAPTPAVPTVDEILADYHESAFQQSAGGVAPCSQSGETLEEETVATLCEAGYEAYNVTAENYESTESALQTDFAGLGLDPNGSYIVVVGGKELEPANTASPAKVSPFPEDQCHQLKDAHGTFCRGGS